MPCVAEFGIIDQFDPEYDYQTYEPERWGCVAVDDDYLNDWWEELSHMKTYFHSYDRPERALARYGITLIPPSSLGQFYRIVACDPQFASRPELSSLLEVIQRARKEEKWMIHYGV